MIGIVDYGMGNLRSVQKAFETLGAQATIMASASQVQAMDHVVLPGVGAFADGMRHLEQGGWITPLAEFVQQGKPFLGICLGMQLLFDCSEEDASADGHQVKGLGWVPGRVLGFSGDPFGPGQLKVPHMGWNTLEPVRREGLFQGFDASPCVYFVHGYYCQPHDETIVAAWTDYGGRFCSSLHDQNIWATQFHPEKSQRTGLKILENFIALAPTPRSGSTMLSSYADHD